jgi:hypothetical protein
MNPKVLVATITSEYKDYCFDDWAENVKSFTYNDKKIIIVDNSRNPDYHQKIQSKLNEAIVIWHPIKEMQSIRECMCECNNITRDYFLKNDFQYMLSLESDIFPRANVIEQLLSHKKLVVGLAYFIWNGCHSKYLNFYPEEIGQYRTVKPFNLDEAFLFQNGFIRPGFNFGFECLMIHRAVLEKIKFRVNLNSNKHIDSFFHEDLLKMKIQAYIDTSYIVNHINKTKWDNIYKKEKK